MSNFGPVFIFAQICLMFGHASYELIGNISLFFRWFTLRFREITYAKNVAFPSGFSLLAVRFSLDIGRERRELKARRDWDETRTRQGVSRPRPFFRPYYNYAFAFPSTLVGSLKREKKSNSLLMEKQRKPIVFSDVFFIRYFSPKTNRKLAKKIEIYFPINL